MSHHRAVSHLCPTKTQPLKFWPVSISAQAGSRCAGFFPTDACPPAQRAVKAATAKKPKLRYSAGKQSRQIRSLRRFMPERLVDNILRKANGLLASGRDRRQSQSPIATRQQSELPRITNCWDFALRAEMGQD